MRMRLIYARRVALAVGSAKAYAGRPIEHEKLPQNVHQFIKQHYPHATITLAKSEGIEFINREYEVLLSNDTRIEFRGNGEWEQIDSREELPMSIVPREIANFVTNRYPMAKVTDMERGRRFSEVTLSNGKELSFDSDYRLVDIDD